MNKIHNIRICAVLAAIGTLLVMLGIWMMSGEFTFDPISEGLALVLLVWLATGSEVARWIVGFLLAVAVLVAVGGAVWFATNDFDFSQLSKRQQWSLPLVVFAAFIYSIVSWRLLVWPRRIDSKRQIQNKSMEATG